MKFKYTPAELLPTFIIISSRMVIEATEFGVFLGDAGNIVMQSSTRNCDFVDGPLESSWHPVSPNVIPAPGQMGPDQQ